MAKKTVKKVKNIPTERDLLVKAQSLQQERIKKAGDEINTILDKYGMKLKIVHNIQVVPKR